MRMTHAPPKVPCPTGIPRSIPFHLWTPPTDDATNITTTVITGHIFHNQPTRQFYGPGRLLYRWIWRQNGLLECVHEGSRNVVATFQQPAARHAHPGRLMIHPGGEHMPALLVATAWIMDHKGKRLIMA